ncbi:MAG: acetate--CoA ligase family protein [Nitrospirae bacterium]|nr:acetate--CoA ligase family protein [Nitrospirota bacterium]
MLDKFFNPASVSVIGAAREPGKVGHSILSNMLAYGYKGAVYPVNPKTDEINGLRSYKDVLSIPGPVDLAVVAVPSPHVAGVIRDCGRKGITAAVVITAGFKETGPEGHEAEREMLAAASENCVRILGPNCLGLLNTAIGLNASFAPSMPHKGSIAFFSQSGALCTAILDWSLSRGVGFSKFVSLGNKSDVSELDMMAYLADDPETKVILGYIEGVENGRLFMERAWETVRKTPVIIAKSGGTAAGAKAASSHTGSLAGSERAFDAAFRQTGVLRASTIQELFNFAQAFAASPIPAGPHIAVVTNAGGPGIIAADAAERSDARMAEFSPDTIARLREKLPPSAGFFNPVDVIGDARSDRYEAALDAVLDDPSVDGALVILTPQAMTDVEETARVITSVRAKKGKPVLASFMGGQRVAAGIDLLNAAGLPVYPYPEDGVKAFEALVHYRSAREKTPPEPKHFEVDSASVHRAISKAIGSGGRELGEKDAREVLTAYGFRVPGNVLAVTSSEAVKAARSIGYPVVMKIASPDILHKTDVGGVKVGVKDDKAVEAAFLEITSNARRLMPSALVLGCMVQEMVSGGREVIIGMSADPQFGPLLMFGMGGIYVEALKDVTFRVAPIDERDAREMVEEIKTYRILKGLRGEKSSDMDAIIDGILRVSQLVTDFPDIVEMDINPFLVMEEGRGAVAVDARLTLK